MGSKYHNHHQFFKSRHSWIHLKQSYGPPQGSILIRGLFFPYVMTATPSTWYMLIPSGCHPCPLSLHPPITNPHHEPPSPQYMFFFTARRYTTHHMIKPNKSLARRSCACCHVTPLGEQHNHSQTSWWTAQPFTDLLVNSTTIHRPLGEQHNHSQTSWWTAQPFTDLLVNSTQPYTSHKANHGDSKSIFPPKQIVYLPKLSPTKSLKEPLTWQPKVPFLKL